MTYVASLANQASTPGAHIDRIKALGDNAWLNLGSPAADPKWGTSRGRSWGAQMVAAPNLRGGFFAGPGPHNYVKPDGPDAGYMDDDFWFYDINAHRWICIYPGTNTQTFTAQVKAGQIKVVNGRIVDDAGLPIPVNAVFGHAWGQLTYNSDQGKLVFYSKYNGVPANVLPAIDDGVALLNAQGNNGAGTVGAPWFYDPAQGRFDRPYISGAPPADGSDMSTNQFIYVSSKKQYFMGGRYTASFFDPVTLRWNETGATGPYPLSLDNQGYYDPKRDRIYLGGGPYVPAGSVPGDNFFIYDVKNSAWSRPYPKGPFPIYFGSNGAFFKYDSVNDVGVLLSGYGQSVYVYSPDSNTWVQLPSTIPQELVDLINSGVSGDGFYDPVLNAFFLYFARDGQANGTVWVYRYKKATP